MDNTAIYVFRDNQGKAVWMLLDPIGVWEKWKGGGRNIIFYNIAFNYIYLLFNYLGNSGFFNIYPFSHLFLLMKQWRQRSL